MKKQFANAELCVFMYDLLEIEKADLKFGPREEKGENKWINVP